jgi:predicted MFS family arabinose efflux permease
MSADTASEPPHRSRRVVVTALGISQTLAWASSYYLPAILAGPIGVSLHVSRSWIFAAFSMALLIAAFAGPVVGRFIDRYGGRGVLALSNIVLAAGLLALAAANGIVALFAAWAVLGIGMALGLYDAGFAALAALYGQNARGPITGVTLFAGFASTVSWPVSTFLNDALGWRETVLVWAALNIVLGLPLNRLVLPLPAQPAQQPAHVSRTADTSIGWEPRKEMLLLAFVFAAAWFVTGAMASHLPALLERAGSTPVEAVAAASLVGPAQVAARLAEFVILRRIHPLVSARIAAVLHPLGAALFAVIGAPAAAAFAVFYGAGNGLLTIARGTVPLAMFGPHGYGERTGLLGAPARAAQAFAPLLFGLLLDVMGLWAIAVSAALCLAALAALLCLSAKKV